MQNILITIEKVYLDRLLNPKFTDKIDKSKDPLTLNEDFQMQGLFGRRLTKFEFILNGMVVNA